MRFDWTIEIGTVIQLFGSAVLIGVAVVSFRTKVNLVLEQQSELMRALSAQLAKHEDRDETLFGEIQSRITDLVGGVQRLVGQNEVFRSGQDRRGP